MTYLEREKRKLTSRYLRGIPLFLIGLIILALSALKAGMVNPIVGHLCKSLLLLVPGIGFFYGFIPWLDLSSGAPAMNADFVELVFVVLITFWGAFELSSARQIKETISAARNDVHRERLRNGFRENLDN